MGIMTGEVVEIYMEDGKAMGKISVGGAIVHVALMLLIDANVGDKVIVDSGIAISRIEPEEIVVE